jgi:hypothetical protein
MRLERTKINKMINMTYRGNRKIKGLKRIWTAKNALFDPKITLA